MILEGIITTVSPGGAVNVAPMGPHVPEGREPLSRFLLKPFRGSATYDNLKATGEAVFHVTDDVLLLAQSAVGDPDPPPKMRKASRVRGFILEDACRYYELKVIRLEDPDPRATMEVEVLASGRQGDFFGFNRAKHAVLEAAILATRTGLLPIEEIEAEFRRLRVPVEKTGGERERQAFAHLQRHLDLIKPS